MKVLYIANYKDGTGWGNSALHNILALDSAGVEVIPRAISFNDKNTPIPARIKFLEEKSSSGADVCVQHTLPSYYSYNSKLKNICFYVTETNQFNDSLWAKSINIMDEAWVPNTQMITASQKSGVTIPVKMAPLCIDINEYQDIPKTASVGELEGMFNFCFVGDFIHRKNIEALLRAFHTEFHPSEPVNLFFKLSKHGCSSDECLGLFHDFSSHVKNSLKVRASYKKEVVISGFLEKSHLLSVMNQCHCFVMPSYGEAWCIPALEAMAVGMPVIYTGGTGMDDFCVGYKISAHDSPCYKGTESLPNIYTAESKWREVDVSHLSQLMRTAYETYNNDKSEFESLQNAAKKRAAEYDLKRVGSQLKEILYGS